MLLTENFPLSELLRSQTATRNDIQEQFNPSPVVIENLRQLCIHVLQPLRDRVGRAVFVNSGYRAPQVNALVGGSTSSQHLLGQAADIECGHISMEELYQRIRNSDLPFDQLIQEFNQWVHVSYNPAGNRRMCLRAVKDNGKTVYLPD